MCASVSDLDNSLFLSVPGGAYSTAFNYLHHHPLKHLFFVFWTYICRHTRAAVHSENHVPDHAAGFSVDEDSHFSLLMSFQLITTVPATGQANLLLPIVHGKGILANIPLRKAAVAPIRLRCLELALGIFVGGALFPHFTHVVLNRA
jgi:hypothetical protein